MKRNHAGHRLTISVHGDAQGIRSVALMCADCQEVLHQVTFRKGFPGYYVASPLSAPTQDGILANMRMARQYEEDVSSIARPEAIVTAPHAWIPELMDDNDPLQRKITLLYGQTVLNGCQALVLCGNCITNGMLGEIATAQSAGIPIFQLNYETSGNLFVSRKEKSYNPIKGECIGNRNNF